MKLMFLIGVGGSPLRIIEEVCIASDATVGGGVYLLSYTSSLFHEIRTQPRALAIVALLFCLHVYSL